jgi:hypothetical protein
MRAGRRSYRGPVALLLAATLAACGGSDICLQCPSGSPTPNTAVTVTGTIASTTPFQNPSTITVIICLNLASGGTVQDCNQSFLTDVNTQGAFTRNNVSPGPETIFFWVDVNGDGTVDPGDPLAELVDSKGLLSNLQDGQTVTIANTNINFTTSTATADISVGLTPTPTPTAVSATPTPQPT